MIKHCLLLLLAGVGIVILDGLLLPVFAQNTGPRIPVIAAASVPFYPRTALLAHIQGVVKIQVTTDGKRASSLVEVGGAPAMLMQAAKENIRTWQFEDHKPTTFLATFEYHIEEPAECSVGRDAIVLRMPMDVRVSARAVHTCDPAIENKR